MHEPTPLQIYAAAEQIYLAQQTKNQRKNTASRHPMPFSKYSIHPIHRQSADWFKETARAALLAANNPTAGKASGG